MRFSYMNIQKDRETVVQNSFKQCFVGSFSREVFT